MYYVECESGSSATYLLYLSFCTRFGPKFKAMPKAVKQFPKDPSTLYPTQPIKLHGVMKRNDDANSLSSCFSSFTLKLWLCSHQHHPSRDLPSTFSLTQLSKGNQATSFLTQGQVLISVYLRICICKIILLLQSNFRK